ncbi:MAG: 5'-3' exonuclease [Herpetosiphonaceae bacterium]|nr:5'-3' exonuclease [Herpetosiphonaceae bacterium]
MTSYHLLLDTSSLLYRAFFALPRSLTDPSGAPINAVHGYLDMTARLLTDRIAPHLPDARIVHVFDHDWRPAGRVSIYPGYKAARPPDPEGLPPQFDLLRRFLRLLGMLVVEAPNWEADDAIGTLCTTAQPGDHVDIVTGDRDLLQLVRDPSADGPTVRVLFTTRGVSELKIFDATAVQAEYGVPPERYVDFAILRGDPSDGLPGVKGIGPKTARDLILRYPTLDALLDDAAAQPPRLATSLLEAQDYIAAMRLIVPVRTDATLQSIQDAADDAQLDELAAAHRLSGPLRRLRGAQDETMRRTSTP